ncbi:MAG: hypothetical protein DMF62_10640 [Acidobacteria bacterium]|nr:MAG: hypothetical protein DMF62_10640 [Acidobacteriota bacterium]
MKNSQRTLVLLIGADYIRLHNASTAILTDIGDELLYFEPTRSKGSLMPFSVGTLITRSAAVVEQMVGGITTKLWDDPFEWTLPERMPTTTDVIAYLNEVEASRVAGFTFLRSDDDLYKKIPSPVEIRTLFEILLQTLIVAQRLYGNAESLLRLVKDSQLSR